MFGPRRPALLKPLRDPHDRPLVRFGLRFFGVLTLVGSPFLIYHSTARYLEGRDSPNWPRVPGEVYGREVYESARPRGPASYSVYIKYRYSVAGVQYTGERVAPDLDNVAAEEKDRLLAKYPVGSKPEVAHSPSDPADSFLEPGQGQSAFFNRVIGPWVIPVGGVALLLASRRPKADAGPNAAAVPPDSEPTKPGDGLMRLGRRMVGVCFVCLVFGWAVKSRFFPETIGSGVSGEILLLLIPIWSVGIIGLGLLVTGWVRRRIAVDDDSSPAPTGDYGPSVRVTCPGCSTALRVEAERDDSTVLCPRCRNPVEVPLSLD